MDVVVEGMVKEVEKVLKVVMNVVEMWNGWLAMHLNYIYKGTALEGTQVELSNNRQTN